MLDVKFSYAPSIQKLTEWDGLETAIFRLSGQRPNTK